MSENGTMSQSRVAVASRSFSRHPVLRQEILARYRHVTFNDTGRSLSGEELIEFLRGHDKAVIALETIDEGVLSRLPDLRVIGKYGVGLDMFDLEAMERHGVLLGWTGGVNKRSVSELVVAAMIALLHRTPESHAEVRMGRWRQIQGRQLTGRTVGIVGCGNIGKDVAILLKSFFCRVLVYDIRDYSSFYNAHGVMPVSLEELLASAEIVTIHLPLDVSTRNMFHAARLESMRRNSCLINMARGGIVDELTLKRLLKEGHLAGAALDVFNEEPPQDNELLNLANVLVTGHIGGSTEEAVLAMGRAAIQGLAEAQLPSMYLMS
ncbi:MAG: phosphoglycerate dehydrogenase [Magnetococcus sp. YQC-5]